MEHEVAVKIPAVSGSSGKLVVERTAEEAEAAWHPGQVFADESLSYEEAMVQFVTDSCPEAGKGETEMSPEAAERAEAKAEKAAWRRVEEELKNRAASGAGTSPPGRQRVAGTAGETTGATGSQSSPASGG